MGIGPGKRKGVTLIDVVVAMFIAAIMLVGFLQVCNSAAYMLKNMKYRVSAINWAREWVEDEIETRTYAQIVTAMANNQFTQEAVEIDEGPTSAVGDEIQGIITPTLTQVGGAPTRGVKVMVQVAWNMLGQARQEIIETVVYDNEL